MPFALTLKCSKPRPSNYYSNAGAELQFNCEKISALNMNVYTILLTGGLLTNYDRRKAFALFYISHLLYSLSRLRICKTSFQISCAKFCT